MSAATAVIASLASAVPALSLTQDRTLAFIRERYGGRLKPRSMKILEKVFAHPGIRKRHGAMDDLRRMADESPDERVTRFTGSAVELSCRAAGEAMRRAGVTADGISVLVVNTCTGYLCPGLSSYIAERLGLRRDVPALDLVGAGCGGAIPNLLTARSLLRGSGGAAISIAVEICSATFQIDDDPSLLVSSALFGDGAAAAVLRDGGPGLALVDTGSGLYPEYREHVRFVYRNGQLHNQLASDLPRVTAGPVAGVIRTLLERNGLGTDSVRHWALHPGGEKIVGALQTELGLGDGELAATRAVLADYGNMSSPSVLFIVERILRQGIRPGERLLAAAFGAGFSAHAALLQAQ